MTSAATAKILLFIALSLGPTKSPSAIMATSSSDNYVWTPGSAGWQLETKGLPADEWVSRDTMAAPEAKDFHAIARHSWHEGSSLDLQDGSRIEKQRGGLFYIQAPGAPNQKVYTILFPSENK